MSDWKDYKGKYYPESKQWEELERLLRTLKIDLNTGEISYRKGRKGFDLDAVYLNHAKTALVNIGFQDFSFLVKDWLTEESKAAANNIKIPTDYKLTEFDDRILKSFTYAFDSEGNKILYYRIRTDTATYKQLPTSSTPLADALLELGTYDSTEKSYYELIESLFSKKNLDNNLLGAGITSDDAGNIIPHCLTFSEYLAASLEAILRNSRYKIQQPLIISNNPLQPAFLHVDMSMLQPGDCSEWADWLLSMPECCRDVYKAFLYSIFDPENFGRQALWIQGAGYDGKSQVCDCVCRWMNDVGIASISKGSMDNQFGYSFLYGKRLAIYGDCKNTKFLHKEKTHSTLGGDYVSIERKGQQPFFAKVHCKMIICSNLAPEINTTQTNEISRLIYIPLQEPPESILRKFCKVDKEGKVKRNCMGKPVYLDYPLSDKLLEQMPAFLTECQQVYNKLCPTRGNIIMPDEMIQLIQNNCGSPEELTFETYCNDFIDVDDSHEVDAAALREHFCKHCETSDTRIFADFKRFIQDEFKARLVTTKRKGKRVRVWKGINLNREGSFEQNAPEKPKLQILDDDAEETA